MSPSSAKSKRRVLDAISTPSKRLKAEPSDDECLALSEEEQRLEARKQRNREAAALSRKRNRDKMHMLESLVQQLQQRNVDLERQVLQLQAALATAVTAQEQSSAAEVHDAALEPLPLAELLDEPPLLTPDELVDLFDDDAALAFAL